MQLSVKALQYFLIVLRKKLKLDSMVVSYKT